VVPESLSEGRLALEKTLPPEPIIALGIDRVLKFAAKGDLAAVKDILTAQPAMLNTMSEGHHRTFVWEAANTNRLDVLKYLVEKGADVNIPGRYRSEMLVLLTPYCIAVKKKRTKIAAYLWDHGTQIDMYSAAFLGAMETLARLVKKDRDAVHVLHPADSAWNVVPLHYAVAGQQLEAARYLVAAGTEVGQHAELLLDMACRLGRLDLVHLLVEAGADPAKAPVFAVVYKGDEEIMEYFFGQGVNGKGVNGKGVDVNKKDGITGWPPIAYVSRGDKGEHPEKVTALIKYGAELNAAGPKGVTALHAAAKAGFVSVLEVLLAAGADTKVLTNAGETPLRLAQKHKRAGAVKVLEAVGAHDI
jgi:hypothetical protein